MSCWGWDSNGQASPPPGRFSALATGFVFTCAIRANAKLVCWGSNVSGVASPPAGTFVALSSSLNHSCAIRTNRTLACWVSAPTPPAGTFEAVTTAQSNTCGIRTDGTLACAGSNTFGESTPPGGRFKAISGSPSPYLCAIRVSDALVPGIRRRRRRLAAAWPRRLGERRPAHRVRDHHGRDDAVLGLE